MILAVDAGSQFCLRNRFKLLMLEIGKYKEKL
jgi:hypothetical protein